MEPHLKQLIHPHNVDATSNISIDLNIQHANYVYLIRCMLAVGDIVVLTFMLASPLSRPYNLMLRFLFLIMHLFLLTFPLVPIKLHIRILLFYRYGNTNQTPRTCMQHASIWTYYTHANYRKTSRRPGL